jgi:hypothetical protein
VLKLTRESTSAVLDLQIPWLQFEKVEKNKRIFSASFTDLGDMFQSKPPTTPSEDVNVLTREITSWFEGLTSHLTKVVSGIKCSFNLSMGLTDGSTVGYS